MKKSIDLAAVVLMAAIVATLVVGAVTLAVAVRAADDVAPTRSAAVSPPFPVPATVAPAPLTTAQFGQVRKGMSEPAVVALIGAPIAETPSATGKTVSYECGGPVVLCAVTYDRGVVIGVLDSRVPR